MSKGMSGEAIVGGAIAFLDQFIARGAARDVHDVRRRLNSDPATVDALLRSVGEGAPDEWDAFVAFRAFLTAEAARKGAPHGQAPNLQELVDWMGPWDQAQSAETRETSDPAQWHDWLASIKRP